LGNGKHSTQEVEIQLTDRAPTEDQVARAKALAEDLLVVLRIEYGKARGDTGGGYQGGGYQQQQAYGGAQQADPYAGYYQVSPSQSFTYTYKYGRLMNSRDKLLKTLHRPLLVLLLVLLLHRDQKLGLSMPLTGPHTDTMLMILNVSSVFVFEARDELMISPSMAGYAVWSTGRDSCCFIDRVKG
jgi:hypothetical protein